MSGKKNLDSAFLEQRMTGLQDFIRRLLGVPKMRQSPDVLPFLGVDIATLKPTTEAAMLAEKLGVQGAARAKGLGTYNRPRTFVDYLICFRDPPPPLPPLIQVHHGFRRVLLPTGSALADTYTVKGQDRPDDVRVVFTHVGYLGLKLTPVDAYCEENGIDKSTIPGKVVVSGFQPCGVAPENMMAARENIAPGFIVSSVQGTAALNCTVEEVIAKSAAGGRPLTIGFLKPAKK